MAALAPDILLPAHDEALTDRAAIQQNFLVLAEALDQIVRHTIDGLNAGQREEQIFASVALPEHLAKHPTLKVQYVSASDISRMLIRQYTGWWDDVPSQWTPASLQDQGNMIIELAGGNMPAISRYARDLTNRDIRLAYHLADWLFYARPDNSEVQQLVVDVYKARILDPDTNTQEMLTYLDQMTAAPECARSR